jgi:hypothetical protein
VSILSGWSNPDAFPTLLEMARTADSNRTKVLALRGCCRLLPGYDVPAGQKMKLYKEILALAERPDEKKLALSALGSIGTLEALKEAQSYLKEPDLEEEACLAVVQLGETLVSKNAADVQKAMVAVIKTTKSDSTKARAQKVAKQAKASQ